MMKDLRAYLKEDGPLLFDGAMGTYFAGLHGPQLCEMANLWQPEDISAIHRSYLDSGCRAIKTNTFAAGVDLARGEPGLARQIMKAGCSIALESARDYDAWVFACIGPAISEETAEETYRAQAELFLEEGMNCFLAETLSSDRGIPELARQIKARLPGAFFIASFAVDPSGMTRAGYSGQELMDRVAALPEVDAVGMNCASGPSHLLRYLKTLHLPDKPFSVMPNAGYPSVQGRNVVYQGAPAYFGEKLKEIVEAGASIVGGCCGTTPKHIYAAYTSLQALRAERDAERGTASPPPVETTPERESAAPPATVEEPVVEARAGERFTPSVTVEERSGEAEAGEGAKEEAAPDFHRWTFGEKLDRGEKVLAVELDPPADDSIEFFLEGAKRLWDAGADAVTIADCPVGRPRADSSLLACKLRRELGIEPLPHMTCRDRNLNATKALLLGLSMEGVHNVLLVTGDPIPVEIRDEVKGVFNFNSRMLARYIRKLNEKDLKTPFRLFGALNLNARNFTNQLKTAFEKEESGITGFLTQPILSKEALHNLRLARDTLKGKILGGIYPVVSYKNACFLNNEIAGMRVDDQITAAYEGKNREEGEELALEISLRFAREAAPCVDGLYLMTPFRRVPLMTRILEGIHRERLL